MNNCGGIIIVCPLNLCLPCCMWPTSWHPVGSLTQSLHESVQHRAEEGSCVVVGEIQSHQHILNYVPDQRQQAAVGVSKHHCQHLRSLANKKGIWWNTCPRPNKPSHSILPGELDPRRWLESNLSRMTQIILHNRLWLDKKPQTQLKQ